AKQVSGAFGQPTGRHPGAKGRFTGGEEPAARVNWVTAIYNQRSAADLVAAGALRLVQLRVRGQHGLALAAAGLEAGDTDAGSHLQVRMQRIPVVTGHGLADLLADGERGGGRRFGEEQQELVAAVTRDDVDGAALAAKDLRHHAQYVIGKHVREAVVDVLEV